MENASDRPDCQAFTLSVFAGARERGDSFGSACALMRYRRDGCGRQLGGEGRCRPMRRAGDGKVDSRGDLFTGSSLDVGRWWAGYRAANGSTLSPPTGAVSMTAAARTAFGGRGANRERCVTDQAESRSLQPGFRSR